MSVSNAIILLDLIQTGMNINIEMQNYFRQRELEGRDVSKEDLKELADENDKLYLDVMDSLG